MQDQYFLFWVKFVVSILTFGVTIGCAAVGNIKEPPYIKMMEAQRHQNEMTQEYTMARTEINTNINNLSYIQVASHARGQNVVSYR